MAVGGENPFERLLTVTVLEVGTNSVSLGLEVKEDAPVFHLEGWDRLLFGSPPAEHTFGFGLKRGNA